MNPDNPRRPMQSPYSFYQVTHAALRLVRAYGSPRWPAALAAFRRGELLQGQEGHGKVHDPPPYWRNFSDNRPLVDLVGRDSTMPCYVEEEGFKVFS